MSNHGTSFHKRQESLSSPAPPLLIFRTSRPDRYANLDFAGLRWRSICGNDDELKGTIPPFGRTVVIWDQAAVPRSALALQRLNGAIGNNPLILDLEFTRSTAFEVATIAQMRSAAGQLLHVVGGADDLSSAVIGFVSRIPLETSAERTILDRIGMHHSGRILAILAGAAVFGKRRLSVEHFASSIQYEPRTLQALLKSQGLPAPGRLLAWMVLAHAMWRIEYLNWSISRTAIEAGFGGPAALSNYFLRLVGERPKYLRDSGGFWKVLHELEAELRR